MSGGTVTQGTLRLGEVGPQLEGDPGTVLTFGSDGRTLSGMPAGGGQSSTDSNSEPQETATPPLVLVLNPSPPAFGGVVVTGLLTINWTNAESSNASVGAVVRIEGSKDGGATYTQIGEDFQVSAFNPSTAAVQFVTINVPVLWQDVGPPTGAVQLRATLTDESSGTNFAGMQFTAAAIYTSN